MSAIELADSFDGIKTHWSFWGQQQEIVATLRSQHKRIEEMEVAMNILGDFGFKTTADATKRIEELEAENAQLRQELAAILEHGTTRICKG